MSWFRREAKFMAAVSAAPVIVALVIYLLLPVIASLSN